MGHFDLYGNSYKTEIEATNAEMAQCAEIESRLAFQKAQNLANNQQRSEHFIYERMNYLEERIKKLEELLNVKNNSQ